MTQADVHQPISGVPIRWGGFTGRQLVWLGVGAALPYLLLRLELPMAGVIPPSLPWLAAAVTLAFGRCEGRRLDAWVGDWLWFRAQPRHLTHPAFSAPAKRTAPYVVVDSSGPTEKLPSSLGSGPLPWIAR